MKTSDGNNEANLTATLVVAKCRFVRHEGSPNACARSVCFPARDHFRPINYAACLASIGIRP